MIVSFYVCIVCAQTKETFEYKVEILQKELQESLRSDLLNTSLQSGADKIV
jgi:hypothetical protein